MSVINGPKFQLSWATSDIIFNLLNALRSVFGRSRRNVTFGLGEEVVLGFDEALIWVQK